MPPSAWTSLPVLAAKAPGKAPFSWPNSSLSMMFAAIALQSSDSSGPLARRLAAWIARARVSLPVPGSPTIRIGRRLRADLAATASAARNSGAAPTNCSSASARRELFGNGRKLAGGAAAVGIGGERLEQPLRRDRADEEIGRAGAHRFDRDRQRCRRATGR